MVLGEAYTKRLWDVRDTTTPYRGIPRLLDSIGSVLQDGALRATRIPPGTEVIEHYVMSGREAFARPLHDGCMMVDPRKVAAARDTWPLMGGYTMLHLGGKPGRGNVRIYERAHRVVTWCIYGPPPASIASPVVMHVCDHGGCLHPDHMVWGEAWENLSVDARAYALARRIKQRGR
jgi:hypothetical protein